MNAPQAVKHTPWVSDGVSEDGAVEGTDCIVQLTGGDRHSVLLTGRGRVFTCGSNDHSQLGHDRNQSRFEKVDAVDKYVIVGASAGQAHNLALDQWGKVFSWGSGRKSVAHILTVPLLDRLGFFSFCSDDSIGQSGHNTGANVVAVPRYYVGMR